MIENGGTDAQAHTAVQTELAILSRRDAGKVTGIPYAEGASLPYDQHEVELVYKAQGNNQTTPRNTDGTPDKVALWERYREQARLQLVVAGRPLKTADVDALARKRFEASGWACADCVSGPG